ncbi:MAG TPA: hypothetical protein DEQ64_08880 [Lachnoclostridium sp.]|uniref:hypothetical protein n=1 Tax=Lacrimispora sp. TaxID=2719234 RepID=UPI000EB9D39E|nr:hypothetical protein [Lacrimispora sp.]HCD43831.1 hypothetical protein [Lachnoclostridium sp.]
MPAPAGLTPELTEAWGNAWSYDGRPPGKYIGSVKQGTRTFYFYKHGNDYYYENDYDREMREQQRERRRNRERRVGKTDS